MANWILIPKLNPVRLFRADTGSFAVNLLPEHEIQKEYCQKYENTDYMTLQFQAITDIGLMEVNLIKSDLTIVKSFNVGEKTSPYVSAFKVAEVNELLTGISEGIYYLNAIITNEDLVSSVQFYSEPIYIKAVHANTILLKYYNDINKFNVIFNDTYSPRIEFQLRVEGGFSSDGFNPGSKDVAYTNQSFDKQLLSSTPYFTKKLTFGNAYGVPEWMCEKLNRMLSCNAKFVNDVKYEKFDGAKLERIGIDNQYPFACWKIEMIESVNSDSEYIDDAVTTNPYGFGFADTTIGFGTFEIGYKI